MIFISMKNRNSISWEQSVRRSLTYTKVVTTFLFFRMHIGFGIVYLILCGIRIKFFNDDSTSDMIAPEHIVFFSEEVLKETLESDKKVVWVIEAITNWSRECEHVAPVLVISLGFMATNSFVSEKSTLANTTSGPKNTQLARPPCQNNFQQLWSSKVVK